MIGQEELEPAKGNENGNSQKEAASLAAVNYRAAMAAVKVARAALSVAARERMPVAEAELALAARRLAIAAEDLQRERDLQRHRGQPLGGGAWLRRGAR